jgi:hypothetical protein
MMVQADGIDITNNSVVAEWDSWGTVGYIKRQQPYGTYSQWTLTCLEPGTVVWANSIIGSLLAMQGSMVSASLVFNEGNLYSGTFTAYVRGLTWHIENRDRFYKVDFQA